VPVNEVTVVGVRVELPTNQPIVLLKEVDGDRYLPIWIGAVEATAIAFAQQQIVTARPMTHDLVKDILDALITDLQDGVFYANLVFDTGVEVSARPSDAIALAMRMGVTIYAEETVLAEAGIPIADEQETEVEKFREFLDQISPDDFNTTG
jgi:bifunctional DNase/RNase